MNYNEQIQRLTKHPEEICNEWRRGIGLFKLLTPIEDQYGAGCLTTIRCDIGAVLNLDFSINEEMTNRIKKDERIPTSATNILPEMFPIFKQYQEEYDQMIEKQRNPS